MKKRAIIIGSGVGGLATACILGQAGWGVTVYEKNEQPGGRLGVFEEQGFRFDTGPSWLLMPDVFEHFFDLLNEDFYKLLDPARLDPSCQVFFKDTLIGSYAIHGDIKKDGDAFETLEPGDKESLYEYVKQATERYQIAKDRFLYKNYDSWLDFLNSQTLLEGLKLNAFTSMDKYVDRFFTSHEVKKIIEYPLLFLGASPKNAPALYSVLGHTQFSQGVYYPKDGMYRLSQVLVELAVARGAEVKCSTTVTKIVSDNGIATGVNLEDGSVDKADIVISNADMYHTEQILLSPQDRSYPARYWRSRTLAPSALLMYLGVRGSYKNLRHHNLVFSKNWDAHFSSIFDRKKWPHDPSFYVCNPNKTDVDAAPEGHENLFVLVPIAPGLRYTEELLNDFSEKILQTMEQTLHLSSLRENTVYKKLFCVEDFEERYNSYRGSALGLAHTLRQTASGRPRNVSKKLPNLYYVGAGTTPGIGLPMCLISAELVYKRLINDRSSEPLKKLAS